MIKNLFFHGLLCAAVFYAPVSLALDLPGVIKYESVVELGLPVSGIVNKVLVDEGQLVSKGDVLLELDDVPFRANLDRAAAELRLLKAERDSVEKAHRRNLELYERMVLSMVSLDDSEVSLVRADSLWQAKKAEYARIRYDFEKSRLHAPFSGLIIERLVEPGQTVRSEMQAAVLFRLASTDRFIVEADVAGDKIGSLAHGVKLEVRLSGRKIPAKVKSVALLTAARSPAQPARYRVRVQLDAPLENVRPGQPAILIISGRSN